jgi:thiamine pyrophosphate-dependent acetolactate synthase large subunit-like protein
MADGWARSTGEVGVATVTFGPALTNALTAVIEAAKSRTPLVLLAANTPNIHDHFQYADIEGFARYAKVPFVRLENAGELSRMLDRAFTLAAADSVPVVVDIPYALLTEETDEASPTIARLRGARIHPDPDAVDDALGALVSAKRPLLIAGRGAVASGAREAILALARAVNAPVMTTLLAKDYFDGEPENLGIHGTLSTPEAIEYQGSADVILSFGASLNNYTTDRFELMADRLVIQSDTDPAAISAYGPADIGIVSDAKALADSLLARLRDAELETKRAAYMDAIAAAPLREAKDRYTSTTGGGTIDMRDATRWLSDALPPGANQVCDLGRFINSTWPHITVDPQRWHIAGAYGAIGLGLPVAAGVAAADRDVPTALYVGDGGAMQGLIELSTAVRHELPLVVMVLNDNCYGAEYLKLEQFGSSAQTSFFEWASFASVAESMGAYGVRATSMEELEPAEQAIREGRLPLLIEVIADPHAVPHATHYTT